MYLPLGNSKSITFTVQASNDVHIGFMCNACNEFYEIVIGGWANTKSVIRKKPVHTLHGHARASASTPGICNGNENRFDTKRDCERQCNKSTRRSSG